MSLLDNIQTRLAAQLGNFNTVALSWTSQPLEDFDEDLPAALHYLESDDSGPSPFGNETIQPGETTIAVLIVCPLADLETRRSELRAALVGWEPDAVGTTVYDVFEHVTGQSLAILGQICWWKDTFTANRHGGG